MHEETGSAGRRDAAISRSRFDAVVFDLDGVVTKTARFPEVMASAMAPGAPTGPSRPAGVR